MTGDQAESTHLSEAVTARARAGAVRKVRQERSADRLWFGIFVIGTIVAAVLMAAGEFPHPLSDGIALGVICAFLLSLPGFSLLYDRRMLTAVSSGALSSYELTSARVRRTSSRRRVTLTSGSDVVDAVTTSPKGPTLQDGPVPVVAFGPVSSTFALRQRRPDLMLVVEPLTGATGTVRLSQPSRSGEG